MYLTWNFFFTLFGAKTANFLYVDIYIYFVLFTVRPQHFLYFLLNPLFWNLTISLFLTDLPFSFIYCVIFVCWLICVSCSGHVSLTYPPARGLGLDFLDNIRTKAPCGMPKGNFTFVINWIIAIFIFYFFLDRAIKLDYFPIVMRKGIESLRQTQIFKSINLCNLIV